MAQGGAYCEMSLERPRRCVHCGEAVGWERLLCPRCGRPADARIPSGSRNRWTVVSSVVLLAFWLALGAWILHEFLRRIGPGLQP